jgi:uncharacterized protein (TIRG00374 family)
LKAFLLKALKFAGFLAIGIVLLYFAFRGFSFDTLWNDLKDANYAWVFLSLFFSLIAFFSRAIRWMLLIEPLGFKPGLFNTFNSLMVGYLANFAFPRLGEITRCATLARKEKIAVDKLIGTVILERAVDVLSLVILLIILIIFRFETFGSFFRESIFIPLGEKLSGVFNLSMFLWIGTGLLLISLVVLYLVLRKRIAHFKFVIRMKSLVRGIIDGLKTIYHMKKRWKFVFHSVFIWIMYWLMTWVLVFSLPSTSQLDIIDGLFILVIGGLGMSAPVQSGIGAYHWIVSRGIASVYPAISLEQGLVFATISHTSGAFFAIGLGTLSFFLLLRKSSRSKAAELNRESGEALTA